MSFFFVATFSDVSFFTILNQTSAKYFFTGNDVTEEETNRFAKPEVINLAEQNAFCLPDKSPHRQGKT